MLSPLNSHCTLNNFALIQRYRGVPVGLLTIANDGVYIYILYRYMLTYRKILNTPLRCAYVFILQVMDVLAQYPRCTLMGKVDVSVVRVFVVARVFDHVYGAPVCFICLRAMGNPWRSSLYPDCDVGRRLYH